jgi:hypothetical protein
MNTARTSRLPDRVEVAVGMKAKVTLNVSTEADLANGSRGEIVGVWEVKEASDGVVQACARMHGCQKV